MQALTSEQQAMVEQHLRIARRAAEARLRRDRIRGRYDRDEIYAEACYGLVCAAMTYDRSRGTWQEYAQEACHRNISNGRRMSYFFGQSLHGKRPRVSLTDERACSLSSPLDAAIRSEEADRLRRAVSVLTTLQQNVIARRMQGETYTAIGASSGVHKTSTLKVERRAHAQLRKLLVDLRGGQ